jgi:hypothetical protein
VIYELVKDGVRWQDNGTLTATYISWQLGPHVPLVVSNHFFDGLLSHPMASWHV